MPHANISQTTQRMADERLEALEVMHENGYDDDIGCGEMLCEIHRLRKIEAQHAFPDTIQLPIEFIEFFERGQPMPIKRFKDWWDGKLDRYAHLRPSPESDEEVDAS